MRFSTLIKRSLTYHRRTNLAVVLGVATAVAVLAGALLVGDSVRASLRALALARLGNADLVITATGFFRERLADDLQVQPEFAAAFNAACPLIVLQGAAEHADSKRRAGNVQIYGVDERFWKFHGRAAQAPGDNDVFVSAGLARELGGKVGDTVITRIEKPSDIPAESLHARKEEFGVTLRGDVRAVLDAEQMGEFALRPQQGALRAVFISLRRLQRVTEQDDKANVILLAAKQPAAAPAAEKLLRAAFTPADLGVRLRTLEAQQSLALESESAVINEQLAAAARNAASKQKLRETAVLTYLANSIRSGARAIPYSLVTALDRRSFEQIKAPGTEWPKDDRRDDQDELQPPHPRLLLNDWAARDLGAKLGDTVTLDYFYWHEEGRIETRNAEFTVVGIVPLRGAAADRDYAPEYPGITAAKTLADWDPPFPIDLERIRPQDEEYWHNHRTTPKAFITLLIAQRLWGTRYGKLTALRYRAPDGVDLTAMRNTYERDLRAAIDPLASGLAIHALKEQSLQAARGATDFGEYFTYFSFFLVVSALLLTALFFKLGVEQRLREIGLLRAVGFAEKRIRSLFLREGALLAVVGSAVGLLGALAYAAVMMFGLRTWWVGAVGTTMLRLHIEPRSLLLGALAGIVTALVVIALTLRSLASVSPRALLAGSMERIARSTGFSRKFRFTKIPAEAGTTNLALAGAIIFAVGGLALLVFAALKKIGQAAGFFGAGFLLLVALLCFWSWWLRRARRGTIQGNGRWAVAQLGFRNATVRAGRSVLCIALIAAATFIIVAVDAFRRDDAAATLDRHSGTGGYPLLAESLLPIVRDLNGAQGREELNLNETALAGVSLRRFRLRPGDDASCLNLYEPRNPRILGAAKDFIQANHFAWQSSLARTEVDRANPWLLLERELKDYDADYDPKVDKRPPPPLIPVIADANSLAYVLHKQLGDDITINADDGTPRKLRVVGALADSIFQGELLMSEANFLTLFPSRAGYRFFLIDAPPAQVDEAARVLEDRLSDFGFDATSTAEKLTAFHQVENTYLSTFQTLGGLGLLLGTFGLATVLLRNVLERRRELALLRATGYQAAHLALMVVAENVLLLGCGLLSGIVCALLAIAPALAARGGRLSLVSLAVLLAAVLVTGLAASVIAVRAVWRAPLLAALRAE